MTTNLDLPDDLVEDIQLRAARQGRALDETIEELLRLGLAVSPVRLPNVAHADASMLEERQRIAGKFLSGEWGVDLAGFAEGRMADRDLAAARDRAWRG